MPRCTFIRASGGSNGSCLITLGNCPLSNRTIRPANRHCPISNSNVHLLTPIVPSGICNLTGGCRTRTRFVRRTNRSSVGRTPRSVIVFAGPDASIVNPSSPVIVPLYSGSVGFRPRLTIIVNHVTGGIPIRRTVSCILNFAYIGSIALHSLRNLSPA